MLVKEHVDRLPHQLLSRALVKFLELGQVELLRLFLLLKWLRFIRSCDATALSWCDSPRVIFVVFALVLVFVPFARHDREALLSVGVLSLRDCACLHDSHRLLYGAWLGCTVDIRLIGRFNTWCLSTIVVVDHPVLLIFVIRVVFHDYPHGVILHRPIQSAGHF